jgi:hypothetical protein
MHVKDSISETYIVERDISYIYHLRSTLTGSSGLPCCTPGSSDDPPPPLAFVH